jgi:hypothetical protein
VRHVWRPSVKTDSIILCHVGPKWPRHPTRGSAAARSLGLRIWIPPGNVLS